MSEQRDAFSLRPFWTPRFWPVWALWCWLRFMAWLPFPSQIRIGKRVGHLLMPLLRRQRLAAERNLALCFPEQTAAEHRSLLVKHFEAYGASISEMGLGWYAPIEKLKSIVRVEGKEHLDAALAKGHGVILLVAHFTCLEVGIAMLEAIFGNVATMYATSRNPMLDAMLMRGRSRVARRQIERSNVRGMLRALRDNSAILYAPDQTYTGSHSELLPFFGEPAVTNTATSKLAQLSGAVVLPYFFRRLADDSGYVIDIEPPLPDFPSGDLAADTRRLVAKLEERIRAAPEQYLWTYRKFKGRPPEFPDVYAPRE